LLVQELYSNFHHYQKADAYWCYNPQWQASSI
jgi:hypothetical protein